MQDVWSPVPSLLHPPSVVATREKLVRTPTVVLVMVLSMIDTLPMP